jgi:hypothetical protein
VDLNLVEGVDQEELEDLSMLDFVVVVDHYLMELQIH